MVGYGYIGDGFALWAHMVDFEMHSLVDYKFFCFDGKPHCLYVSKGLENHETAGISFYDLDGNELPYHRSDYYAYHNAYIPETFMELKRIATTLAGTIPSPFVRVDLYSIDGKNAEVEEGRKRVIECTPKDF